jgi:hypothetical protein
LRKRQFFAKHCRKSQKIVIITFTLGRQADERERKIVNRAEEENFGSLATPPHPNSKSIPDFHATAASFKAIAKMAKISQPGHPVCNDFLFY